MKRRVSIEPQDAFDARMAVKVEAGARSLARKIAKASAQPRGVIGLDLSLRGPAACWLPLPWTGKIASTRTGKGWGSDLARDASPEAHAERNGRIAAGIVDFCRRHPFTAIAIEGYAYQIQSSSAAPLHELGGVVKHELFKAFGVAPVPITASAARRTLLSNVPRKDSKEFVISNIRRLGGQAVYWTGDEADAFCVANMLVMLEGGVPLSYEGK